MKRSLKFTLGALLTPLVALIIFLGYIKISEPKQIYPFNDTLGITALPHNLGNSFFKAFDRYTKITAPNGGAIHIVAQNQITNEQMIRCRNILQHYLTDYKGSQYGDDKSDIANKMVENQAVLTLQNGQDDGNMINAIRVLLTGLYGQALFYNEIQVEGHEWYTQQNYMHRDASYEEILHFVHDNGIGVDGNDIFAGARPELQKEIRAAQINGLKNKIWASDAKEKDWLSELEAENSLSQEYLASVIDTYYGLWGAWKHTNGGMWGLYKAKTRAEIAKKDSLAHTLMNNKFFHPYITYNARIHHTFKGTFSLRYNTNIPYTNHSRYLKDITLLGKHNIDIIVNEMDNNIIANEGINTVIFSGKSTEYNIQTEANHIVIHDTVDGRDGTNVLKNVEKIQFTDNIIEL